MKRFFIFITLLTSFFSISSAQQAVSLQTASSAYCPYTFTRDLKTGSIGADVKVLQQILNSDQRTVVATSGIASPGNETESYGTATREAVKKFQALFIEYIGVANGVFGPKTRTVMNAVCNGEYYTSGRGQVYSGVSTQNTVNNNLNTTSASTSSTTADTVAPAIYLRSNSTSIDQGLSFRIIVTASEPIQTFTPESIIIEGGSVSDIRKLSPNSYSLLVTPNSDAKSVVAQVEADRVLDLAGNKNDNASNEIRIVVTQTVATTTTSTTTATVTSGITSGELDSIFNRILAQVTPATPTQPTTCSNGATNPPYCNNQYNNQPNYNSGSNNSGQNQQNSLMNMLLLSRLLGGNNNSGGGLFGNLFGGGSKTPQPGYTGAGSTGSGGGTGGTSAADIQACANGDKTKCGGVPVDAPLPPKRPEDLNNPKSGEIIREIDCAVIKTQNSYIVCGNGTKAFLVKETTLNYNFVLVIGGKGQTKDIKGGQRFVVGQTSASANYLAKKLDYKICTQFEYRKNECINEVYKVDGKDNYKYVFTNEETTTFSEKGDGRVTEEFCKNNPQSDLCPKAGSQQPQSEQKCYVSSMQWNAQSQKCEPINYNQPLQQSSNGQNNLSGSQDPMNPSSYPSSANTAQVPQTNNAYNDPNLLTPSFGSLTPQQCADKANSIYQGYSGNGYLSNAITAVIGQYPECGYGRIQKNFWGTKAIPTSN